METKIVSTEEEINLAILQACLTECESEGNRHIDTKDIMRIGAHISDLVLDHITGQKRYDEEEFNETRCLFRAAEARARGKITKEELEAACLMAGKIIGILHPETKEEDNMKYSAWMCGVLRMLLTEGFETQEITKNVMKRIDEERKRMRDD